MKQRRKKRVYTQVYPLHISFWRGVPAEEPKVCPKCGRRWTTNARGVQDVAP